jgi:hypothetical protein
MVRFPDERLGIGERSILVNTKATRIDLTALPTPTPGPLRGGSFEINAEVSGKTEGIRAPTGTVTFSVDGNDQATVALTISSDQGASEANFNTSALTQKIHTVTATYSGDASFDPSSADVMLEIVGPDDGPRVVAVDLRPGGPAGTFLILLTFDEDLNPVPAQFVGNYSVKRFSNTPVRVPIPIPIRNVVYDPATRIVMLTCRRRGSIAGHYLLVVNGTAPNGISDVSGRLLDGEGTGRPGSDFTTFLDGTRIRLTDSPTPPPSD